MQWKEVKAKVTPSTEARRPGHVAGKTRRVVDVVGCLGWGPPAGYINGFISHNS